MTQRTNSSGGIGRDKAYPYKMLMDKMCKVEVYLTPISAPAREQSQASFSSTLCFGGGWTFPVMLAYRRRGPNIYSLLYTTHWAPGLTFS